VQAEQRSIKRYGAQYSMTKWVSICGILVLLGEDGQTELPESRRETHQENNIGNQKAAHGVANENDVRGGPLVGYQPFAKVVAGHVDGLVRLVSGVDFSMDDMGLTERVPEEVVNVCGKGTER